MTIRQLLRYQWAFTAWANARVMNAVSTLTSQELAHDFKTADKTILGTLAHCYRAERVWLNRLNNTKVDFKVEGDDTLVALQNNWPPINGAWSAWAADLSEEDAATAELTYTDLKGNPWTQPLWTIALHVVNHSSHHRGQVIGFIRSLGHTPPDVDLIIFSRELTSPPGSPAARLFAGGVPLR